MNAWPTCWINWPTTIPDKDVASTRGALQTAASKLRAAVDKAQALSAISQCRALIAGPLAKVRAIGAAMSRAGVAAAGPELDCKRSPARSVAPPN